MHDAKEQAKKQSQDPMEEQGFDINTDENMKGTSHLNDPVVDETELDSLRNELEQIKDKLLRKQAEFDNFRKRSIKERTDLIQTAGKEVITDLLDVLDDTARAEKQMMNTEDLELIREGVALVFSKLRTTLATRGLKPIETIGKDFDPDVHEAVSEIPAKDPSQSGKILDEVVTGYTLNDKIIRHPKVIVGK